MSKKVEKRFGNYIVRFVPQRVWDIISIYEYCPDAKFFKTHHLASYIECGMRCEAACAGIKLNQEDALVKLAEFTLNHYLEKNKEMLERENLKRVQENFLLNS